MSGFLHHIADELQQEFGNDMGEVTVVFPNQRAGLYLRQVLKDRITTPAWAPDIVPFRELVQRESAFTIPDSLFLTFELFNAYRKVMPGTNSFEEFYFWGQMLLRDFDELDKYMIPSRHLYKDLSRQKELDLTFDFLTDEQKTLVREFWRGFVDKRSEAQENFLLIWNRLFDVYSRFRQDLNEQGYAYEGQVYRELADNVATHRWKYPNGQIWFAGFNALTKTEETIIGHFMSDNNARLFWDIDAYYVNDKRQEAGSFLRMYRRHKKFSRSFPTELPDRIRSRKKRVNIIGVPQYVGQAKIASQYLEEILSSCDVTDLRRVALVLADETLLLPVLHSLPSSIQSINITMGFPLVYAPITSLIEQLTELQLFSRRSEGILKFHSRYIARIENHPVINFHMPADRPWAVNDDQRLYWEADLLHGNELCTLLYSDPGDDFVSYLTGILEELSIVVGKTDQMTSAHIHYYLKHLYRYHELIDTGIRVETFRKLFHQLVRIDKIPFTGEPLEGLQIMGVLETRNLDFEHVLVLGMNEESFPGGKNQHSYIPYNLRKAYELPHYDQQDAIYAYLFYRLLHNAASVTYFYNTEGDQLGGEEMSRFLKQLIYERPFEVKHQLLQNIASVSDAPVISPKQNEGSLMRLQASYVLPEASGRITPSAINVYLDCKLKFYYRYIARLYEQEELEDSVDARTLGSLIHFSVEQLYLPFLGKEVQKSDVDDLFDQIPEAINGAFRKMYNIDSDESFDPEGKNIIAEGVARKFLRTILEKDKEYAPFTVLGLEVEINEHVKLSDNRLVRCGGFVDRIDRKGARVRIVDFKSGKDSASFKDIESLFTDNRDRNKAAFQTFFYAALYSPNEIGIDVVPVVYNRNVLFQDADPQFTDSSLDRTVDRFGPYREKFSQAMTEVIEEIFSPETVFDQTDDTKKCGYCPYNIICQRAATN